MVYDLVRQRYPGAPCAVGARVRSRETGNVGTIAPPRTGDHDRLCVRFDGSWPPVACDPRELEYLRAPVIALGGARSLNSLPSNPETSRP